MKNANRGCECPEITASQSNSVKLRVRGVERTVYLENQIGPNRWTARLYLGSHPSKTVRGIFQVYSNGTRRFLPRGTNADML